MAGFFRRLVQPFQRMPRALPIATPILPPIATPIADVLTNIGATDIAHPGVAPHISAAVRQKYGLPTATNLEQTQPDPLWTTRWQNSTSPPDERPWVKGYRYWAPHVHYQSWFENSDYFRIDFLWSDHAHAYWDIPRGVWEEFRRWTGSVGEWFHDNILVPGWKPGAGARYPDRAISR